MLKADPEFILGNCLKLTLDLFIDDKLAKSESGSQRLRALEEMANNNPHVTKRELKHIDALNKYANGEILKALAIWESILLGKLQNKKLTFPLSAK